MKWATSGEFLSAFPELYALPLIAPVALAGGVARPGRAGRDPARRRARARRCSRAGAPDSSCPPRPAARLRSAPRGHRRPHPCRRPRPRPASVASFGTGRRLRPRRGPASFRPTRWDLPASARVRGWPAAPSAGDKRKAAEPFALPLRRGRTRAAPVAATPTGGYARVRSRVYGNEYQCRSGLERAGPSTATPIAVPGRWVLPARRPKAAAAPGLATLADDDFGGGAGDADGAGHLERRPGRRGGTRRRARLMRQRSPGVTPSCRWCDVAVRQCVTPRRCRDSLASQAGIS